MQEGVVEMSWSGLEISSPEIVRWSGPASPAVIARQENDRRHIHLSPWILCSHRWSKKQKFPVTLKGIAHEILTGGDIEILEWVSGMLMEALFNPRKEHLKDPSIRSPSVFLDIRKNRAFLKFPTPLSIKCVTQSKIDNFRSKKFQKLLREKMQLIKRKWQN